MPDENQAPPSPPRLPQGTKDLWLPLLESGTLEQAIGALMLDVENNGFEGYCCLGVLAKAAGCTFVRQTHTSETDDGEVCEEPDEDITVEAASGIGNINDSETLRQDWADQYGLSNDMQLFLAACNDGGEHHVSVVGTALHLWDKHCVSKKVNAPTTSVFGDKVTYKMRKHSFAEIAKIIREDL